MTTFSGTSRALQRVFVAVSVRSEKLYQVAFQKCATRISLYNVAYGRRVEACHPRTLTQTFCPCCVPGDRTTLILLTGKLLLFCLLHCLLVSLRHPCEDALVFAPTI